MFTQWLIVMLIALAILAYVWFRLRRSNMDIPPGAEQAMTYRERLRFALDNDIPVIAVRPDNPLNDSRNPNVNRGW